MVRKSQIRKFHICGRSTSLKIFKSTNLQICDLRTAHLWYLHNIFLDFYHYLEDNYKDAVLFPFLFAISLHLPCFLNQIDGNKILLYYIVLY
jgi:hypothetical protein